MEADDLTPRERQIDHVLRTRERQIAAVEAQLAHVQDRWWAARALVATQVAMSLAPIEGSMWRKYAARPERILADLTKKVPGGLISVGMLVDALDRLVEDGHATRGVAGDYWWTAGWLP